MWSEDEERDETRELCERGKKTGEDKKEAKRVVGRIR